MKKHIQALILRALSVSCIAVLLVITSTAVSYSEGGGGGGYCTAYCYCSWGDECAEEVDCCYWGEQQTPYPLECWAYSDGQCDAGAFNSKCECDDYYIYQGYSCFLGFPEDCPDPRH